MCKNNLESETDTLGARAWHRITKVVAGKSGARFAKLSKSAHRPKVMTHCTEAMAALTRWQQPSREMIKLLGQDLSDLAKIEALKCMEEDGHDAKFPEAWMWTVEQIPCRRVWQHFE